MDLKKAISGSILNVLDGTYYSIGILKSSTDASIIKLYIRGYINIVVLVILLREANNNCRILPSEIGVKADSGVLVDSYLFTRIINQHQNLLDYLNIHHGVRLFGRCDCRSPCLAARIFLGTTACSTSVQKSLLLSELIMPDVASVIRAKMFA